MIVPAFLTPPPRIRLGTRASALALWQARHVAALLRAAGANQVDIIPHTTSGDRLQHQSLTELGGKGLFTKELDQALLNDALDCAVHSLKDVATRLPDGLMIAATLPRADPRDRLICADGRARTLMDLPMGARIGTSSLRRMAQVKATRPDLTLITPYRGNVATRLEKLAAGVADATLLAAAGLTRLGGDYATLGTTLSVETLLPAPAQGAIALTIRTADEALQNWLAAFNHAETALTTACERAFLAALDGSCRTPIAAHAIVEDSGATLWLRGEVFSPDGTNFWSVEGRFPCPQAAAHSHALGLTLRSELPDTLYAP